MKKIYILALVLIASQLAFAQKNDLIIRNALKKAAKDMDVALIKKDYKGFVKFTYPKAMEMTEGGETKLVADLESQVADMEKEGNSIVAAWPGEPSVMIDTAGELQTTIPQKMAMQYETGKLTTETTLIATSPDKGKTWYFIDAADRSIEDMRTMFPTLSSKLILKKSPEPTFETNKKAESSKK